VRRAGATTKVGLFPLLAGIACSCLVSCGTAGSTAANRSTSAARSSAKIQIYEVTVRAIRGLGPVLADGDGFTLYAYIPDRQGRSKCALECASIWPPLLLPRGVVRAPAGSGIKAALLGTTRRANGSLQVTYHRWPLYLYRDDGAPGEASGQGDDMGLWFVLSPNGSVDFEPLSGQSRS
jgi:predicted lipoprotein with Yx(FWY)xxD motif